MVYVLLNMIKLKIFFSYVPSSFFPAIIFPALFLNSTASGSTALGYQSLYSNTVSYNTAVGYQVLYANTTGQYNTAIGGPEENNVVSAMRFNTTGAYNTALGSGALGSNTTSTSNTSVGYKAGYSVTTGNDNLFVGRQAGESQVAVTTGGQNTFVGAYAGGNLSSAQFQIAIGYNCRSAGDNGYVTIGHSTGVDRIYCQYTANATWTRVSDLRTKKDVQDGTLGLEFINKLRTVTYKKRAPSEMESDFVFYDAEDSNVIYKKKLHGFIAQEVKQALEEVGESDFNGWHEMENGVQGVSYEMFVMPLVKAVQELKAELDTVKAELAALKG
jgi:hypothetical protein